MLPTIQDVWINWSDGEDKRNRLPEYFEWKEEDKPHNFVQMPVVLIDSELLSFIEEECKELPRDLLKLIEGQARNLNPATKRVRKENYAAVLTDGERILAIYTEGSKKPTLKSRLIPRQDNIVRKLVEDEDVAEIKWEKPEVKKPKGDGSLIQSILEVNPLDVIGLTRKERELREILIENVFRLSCSDNDSEIMYWYVELFPEQYGTKEIKNMTRDDMLKDIFDTIKTGWTSRHLEFGNNLVKYYDDSKDLWDKLVKEDVSKEKEKVKR